MYTYRCCAAWFSLLEYQQLVQTVRLQEAEIKQQRAEIKEQRAENGQQFAQIESLRFAMKQSNVTFNETFHSINSLQAQLDDQSRDVVSVVHCIKLDLQPEIDTSTQTHTFFLGIFVKSRYLDAF